MRARPPRNDKPRRVAQVERTITSNTLPRAETATEWADDSPTRPIYPCRVIIDVKESEVSVWLRRIADEIDRGQAKKLCVTPDYKEPGIYAICVEQTTESLRRLKTHPGDVVVRHMSSGRIIDSSEWGEEEEVSEDTQVEVILPPDF